MSTEENTQDNEIEDEPAPVYTDYVKKGSQQMRPYIEGEDMAGISIGEGVEIGPGGMVAVDSKNPEDKWYIPKNFFEENYAPAGFEKSLGNTDQDACRKNVTDVVIFGEDLFKLLSKASSNKEGWMKSTKAMETPTGCVIQVTTQQRNPDGSYSVAEALTNMRGVKIVETKDKDGVVTARRLM